MGRFKQLVLLILFLLVANSIFSQAVKERYWVAFTDKQDNTYSLDKPEDFLSERALERRRKQGIALDERDLPVTQRYIDSLIATGARVRSTSKWLNGATIETDSAEIALKIKTFSFVDAIALSWTSLVSKSAKMKMDVQIMEEIKVDPEIYGQSLKQLTLNNHHLMHDLGYRGEGMLIAVLDAGYVNVDKLPAFDSLRTRGQIMGIRDFVDPYRDFYSSHYHGMMVLSCMGGIIPGMLMGSAPDADYFLITTEDNESEFPVEMDNWVAGAELADSIGADIINSSLGYSWFDDASMNYSYAQMDGNTARVTRGADIAASKGMLICNSAGNEGDKAWKKLIAPSDGDSVLSVGSMDQDSAYTAFSSRGPASDGRVKPNTLANGRGVTVQSLQDTPEADFVGRVNGTSFSSPLMAGMAACLWQALPEKSAMEIKAIIEKSSHLYDTPNDSMGFGIANIYKAYSDNVAGLDSNLQSEKTKIFYVQSDHALYVREMSLPFSLELYDVGGRLLLKTEASEQKRFGLSKNLSGVIVVGRLVFSGGAYSQTLFIP